MKKWLLSLVLGLTLAAGGSYWYLADATVNEVTPAANRYTANGSTTVFAYTYRIYSSSDLEVLVDTTVKTLTTHYTVSGVSSSGGGSVTFLSAPANTSIVTIIRKQPLAQSSTYTPGSLSVTQLERDFDKLTMQVQRLAEKLGRALAFNKNSSLVDQPVDVPTVGQFARAKAGGGIDWATPTNAGALSSPVAVVDGGTAATTAAGARTNLGVLAINPSDAQLIIVGSGDATKQFIFEVDGITTGQQRIWTVPDANLTFPAMTTKGDLMVASASGVLSRQAAGANGTVPMARSAATTGLAYVAALTKAIYGFTYANNGTDNLDIAAGGAMDATGAYWITTAALTKQSNVNWAVGNNAGGLDTGAVGNSDYYMWTIVRSDTGVTDYLFSLSSTAPTMPTNYDFKRLIGWFKRVGGTIVAFHTYEVAGGGLQLTWDVPSLDISLVATLTTARRTDAVKVPLNFSVEAILNIGMIDAALSSFALVSCPDETDAVVDATNSNFSIQTAAQLDAKRMIVRTSATGTIAARASIATMDNYNLRTIGFTWARRN